MTPVGDDGPPGGLVVELVTVESWRLWRDVRLASLIDSPRAFWMTYAESAGMPDDHWRERAATAGPTWLALDDGHPVGTVGLWHAPDQPDDEVVLVGMWVATVARGTDVATRLVETALARAAASGYRRVVLDVAHENARARAFYIRLGFRATGAVGLMPWDPAVTEQTLALDLPVTS